MLQTGPAYRFLHPGNKHAAEIATMALDLLAGSSIFVVPHRPTEKLQLRSGLLARNTEGSSLADIS